MKKALKLAGFLTAHALVMIKGGDRHVVNYGYIDVNDQEHAQRIQQGLLTKNIQIGQNTLVKNPKNAICASLVYNCMGDIMKQMLEGDKVLVVEVKSYTDDAQIILGLRYDLVGEDIRFKHIEVYYLSGGLEQATVLKTFWGGFFEHELSDDICTQTVIDTLDAYYMNDIYSPLPFYSAIGFGAGGVLHQEAPLSSIPTKYDDMSWHYGEQGLPEGYKENALCVHIGVFAIWCVLNDLSGDDLAGEASDLKDGYKNRTLTPGQWCCDHMDGRLLSDDLNDTGNAFAYDYFSPDRGDYTEDYTSAVGDNGIDYTYSVADTWKTYDTVAKIIDRRYDEWTSKRKTDM